MRITEIETFSVALPTRREHRWTTSLTEIGRPILVRVGTDEGLVGLGEAPVTPEWGGDYGRYYGETPVTAAHLIETLLGPALLGMSPFDIGAIHDRMAQIVKGHMYAKAAIDIACYDLMGKATGLPAHAFLGGRRRDTIEIAHSFGLNLSPEEAAEEAQQVLEDGVRNFKVKIGTDGERNRRVVGTLRSIGKDEVDIHVDANTAWPDAKTALHEIRRLEEYDILWVEQPCDSAEQLAQVTARTDVKVMADESSWTARDVYDLSRVDAVDLISIYTTKAGGLYPSLAVATLCETTGRMANLNGSLETGIGNAANLHVAAAAAMTTLPCVLTINAPRGAEQTKVAGRYYTDDIITEPYDFVDGRLVVPTGPGLGVELDEAKVSEYLVSGSER
jgi:muconate cycloisomerase